MVRDPARLPIEAHRNLQVVAADVMAPASILDAVTGRDAVVSAIGKAACSFPGPIWPT